MPKYRDEWWHTDSKGRRIGWVWPDELQQAMDSMYGEQNATARRLAHDLGIDPSKVSRWLSGKDPVPRMVALILHMRESQRAGKALPEPEAPWLPITDSCNGRTADASADAHMRSRGRPKTPAQDPDNQDSSPAP